MASTFSTNSVNMFYMADNGLIQAMAAAMKDRNLGLRAAASLLDVSHPTLGKVLNGEEASFEFCVKASGFLKIPPDQVFRLAGLLPPVPAKTEQTEHLLYLFNQLPQNEKDRLIHHIEATLMILEREGLIKRYLAMRDDDADPLFLSVDDRARLTYSGLRWIVINRSKEAKVKPRGIHTFRRLYALTMLRNGVDVISLSRLLGHNDLTVLRRYLAQTDDDLREAHAKASPIDREDW